MVDPARADILGRDRARLLGTVSCEHIGNM
jgi:hypothetical protein